MPTPLSSNSSTGTEAETILAVEDDLATPRE